MPEYYKIKGETLTNIADAIREKIGNGGGQITPLGMPDKIASIDSGGTEMTDGIVVKTKTSNGYPVSIDVYGDPWAYMFGESWNSTHSGLKITDVTFKKTKHICWRTCLFFMFQIGIH